MTGADPMDAVRAAGIPVPDPVPDQARSGLCECGCGYRAPRGRHYVTGHLFTRGGPTDPHTLDNIAVAVFTGAADARNGRPRRVDIADTSPIGQAYSRGYDAPDAWTYQ